MLPIAKSETATAFELLADAVVRRNNDIRRYEADDAAKTGQEVESEWPMFDRFVEQGGSDGIC